MVPKRGYSLREVEGIVNEGGHEEHFHYSQEVVDDEGNVVVSANNLSRLLFRLEEKIGSPGIMLSGSKSLYTKHYPHNIVVFNSNVCIDEGKVWHGDIDVTRSSTFLQKIAKEFGKPIYVLYEMDARFGNENNPRIDQAVVTFYPNGKFEIREDLRKYYTLIL